MSCAAAPFGRLGTNDARASTSSAVSLIGRPTASGAAAGDELGDEAPAVAHRTALDDDAAHDGLVTAPSHFLAALIFLPVPIVG
jgi:hypothetical protein